MKTNFFYNLKMFFACVLLPLTLASCASNQSSSSTAGQSTNTDLNDDVYLDMPPQETLVESETMRAPDRKYNNLDELKRNNMVFFDFDTSLIRPEFADLLTNHARYLSANQSTKIVVEGHTDQRGTPEYNIALGERRANAVAAYLTNLGVLEEQISIVSFGEEKLLDSNDSAAAWTKNRRAVISYN